MKKTLIALAAVAVTSTAFAQVTISGRINAGTVSSKTTNSSDSSTANVYDLVGYNTKTTSRITFAGSEDLGGGTTAFFNAEQALNGGALGARNLFVGARGSFGSVQLGRYLNTHDAARGASYAIGGGAGGDFMGRVTTLTSSAGTTLTNYGLTAGATVSATSTLPAAVAGFQPTNFFVRSDDGASTKAWVQVFASSSAGIFKTADGAVATSTSLVTMSTESAINASVRATNAANAAALNALMTAYSGRSNNGLGYTTPNMGGFTLTVGLADNSIKSNNPASTHTGENQAKVSAQSYSLAYASGPLSARATLGTGKVTTETQGSPASATAGSVTAVGVSRADMTDNAYMVSYDLGVAQTFLMYNTTDAQLRSFQGTAANAKRETDAMEIGIQVPMGNLVPFATFGNGNIKTSNAGVANTATDIKTTSYQLGLNYNLSKRTNAYFSTGQTKNKTTTNIEKTTGTTLGLVHNF